MRRVLLGAYYLDLSGSSTFVETLALALRSNNIHVVIFAIAVHEETRTRLLAANVLVETNLSNLSKYQFDGIISQHNVPSILVRDLFPQLPMLYIVHGTQSFLEEIPSIDLNISKYIVVSEEIREKLIFKGQVNTQKIEIIRNFVDTDRFQPFPPIHTKPQKVLFLSSRYTDEVLRVIKKACAKEKLALRIIGKDTKTFQVEHEITSADIVISLGRGIIESMSCGRFPIVYDYQGGDGAVLPNNYRVIARSNFSGRCFQKSFSVSDLRAEINKYSSHVGGQLRKIVKKEFNVVTAAEKFMFLLMNGDAYPAVPSECSGVPVVEMEWLIKRMNFFAGKKRA